MSRRAIVRALGLLAVAAAAAVTYCCAVDRDITKPPEKRDLKADEIRAKLTGSDFKEKLEAEKQIDKLEPDEKRRILLGLSGDADPAVRLIAVKHLRRLDHPDARAALEKLAAGDPDPTVRELAGSK
jgi:hypothetical protein